ncbi:hypothetical protein F0231_10710 [Vibrio sp. RE86]|uniref:hypothetical protein n=1 Tax=Vibrio sp. RE86 TaxID=2607605 RepID=UPI00149331ED|nr:hypothetical protein [Vibrio sp. RE86]NOH80205.1 hypothetical protein [Vibrio sp. RE86]
MKKYLLLSLLVASSVYADTTEQIIADDELSYYKPFSLDMSYSNDGDAVLTGNLSYELNDNWRLIGELDTDKYWEVGIARSFYTQSLFFEASTYIAEERYSAGMFSAYPTQYGVTLLADVNYNWYTSEDSYTDIDRGTVNVNRSDSVDFMLGLSWDMHEKLDLTYGYNRVVGVGNGLVYFESLEPGIPSISGDLGAGKDYYYHDITLSTSISGTSPYITYTLSDDVNNSVEFGIAIRF